MACDRFILCPGEQELGIGGLVVALIGRNELAVLGFIRVFPIVQTILQRAGDGFPLADMVGNESGGLTLNYLYEKHPDNLMIIDKLSLVLLKALNKDAAMDWLFLLFDKTQWHFQNHYIIFPLFQFHLRLIQPAHYTYK